MRRVGLAFVFAVGCVAEPPPTTLEINDVQPHEVDVGDRLEIAGAGFPLRRTAKIAFRGTLHRGGVPAEAVNLTFDVESRSEGRLELPVDEALATRFLADGDTGHATFRGEVTVSFAALEAGAAPLRGHASNVIVDVRGSRKGKALAGRDAARTALDGLGMTIADEAPASGGLVVAAVRPSSPAAGAGILPRDVIVELDGVRVATIADLVPAGEMTTTVAIRRDQGPLRTIVVPLDGALRRVPRTMIAGAGIVAAASLLLLLSMRKPSAASAMVERRIAARVRALSAGATARNAMKSAFSILAGESSLHASMGAVLFTFVCGLAAFATPLVLPELDVVSLSLAAFAASAATTLQEGGFFRIMRPHVAGGLAVATAIVSSGAFRLADMLRAQGALPWEWLAFRTPAALLSVVIWIVAAGALPKNTTADRSARYVAAGLIATLFLGGFRVPGVRTIEHEAWSLAAIGAIALVLKAWVAMLAIDFVRVMLPVVRASAMRARLLVLVAALTPFAAHGLSALPWSLTRAIAVTTFGAAAVVLTFAGMRVYGALSRIGPGHLDPHV
jgi:hypothetical protein